MVVSAFESLEDQISVATPVSVDMGAFEVHLLSQPLGDSVQRFAPLWVSPPVFEHSLSMIVRD